ncbi:MAG: CDP-diacylglycerol--glycerol-3-phosphate 3-phosphatidyltransferase [Clostridia bacterium]|nr:CDP-diacylglycerol--glycerol-3-phosphate 3-phosphatidyltransferase [Clostridia bacterium]
MNTPNKLTVLRICLVPLFMVFLLLPQIPAHILLAAICFASASLTDLLDGSLARKNNQITNFGKFLDPLADKLLVTSALVCFVQMGLASAWIAMIIIAREFLVTSLRLIAAGSGTVIAANIWGKTKTVSQIVAIIAILLFNLFGAAPAPLALTGQILLWIAAALTIISGIQYVWAYREYIDTYK